VCQATRPYTHLDSSSFLAHGVARTMILCDKVSSWPRMWHWRYLHSHFLRLKTRVCRQASKQARFMKITHVNFFFPTKRPSFIWTFIRHHEMVVFLIRMVLYMNLISTSLVLLSCSIVILDTAFFNSFCVDVDTVLADTYFCSRRILLPSESIHLSTYSLVMH